MTETRTKADFQRLLNDLLVGALEDWEKEMTHVEIRAIYKQAIDDEHARLNPTTDAVAEYVASNYRAIKEYIVDTLYNKFDLGEMVFDEMLNRSRLYQPVENVQFFWNVGMSGDTARDGQLDDLTTEIETKIVVEILRNFITLYQMQWR